LEKGELVQVSFRIPRTLRDLIRLYLAADLYVNESEFFRDALREKIRRDTLSLYELRGVVDDSGRTPRT